MAKRRKKINIQDWAASLLTIAVTIGTVIVIFFIPPEQVQVQSGDTVVSLSGISNKEDRPSVKRREDIVAPFTAIVSPVYEITTPTQLPDVLEIEFKYDLSWLGNSREDLLQLLIFDQILNAWRPVVSEVNFEKKQVEAVLPQVETESLWGLGIVLPLTFEREQDLLLQEILQHPPEGAISYQAYSALAIVPGDFVVIRDPLNQGGCDGLFQVGKEKLVMVAEKTVNGATLNVTVVWQRAHGCVEGEVIRATGEVDHSKESAKLF